MNAVNINIKINKGLLVLNFFMYYITDLLNVGNNCWVKYHKLLWQKRRERVCKTLDLKVEDTSYSDIMQRLVKRYLFKMERAKDEKESGNKKYKSWEPYKAVVYELYLFTNAFSVGIHRSSRIIGFHYHDPPNHVVIMKSYPV